MSNDRYSAGALIQRLHGLMSCAGLEQRFNFFFFLVWWQEEDGGWAGWGMLVVFSKTGWPWLVQRLVCFVRAIQEWLLPA